MNAQAEMFTTAAAPPQWEKAPAVIGDAVLSECGRYRFLLARVLGEGPMLVVIMMNPSTASATADDPTIRTLCKAARGWGYGSLWVLNICPLRAPQPFDAYAAIHRYRYGYIDAQEWHQHNLVYLEVALRSTADLLVAWGDLPDAVPGFKAEVLNFIAAHRGEALHLGTTKAGNPKHPLARGSSRPDFAAKPALLDLHRAAAEALEATV